jgi:NitT/TauT family transport system substrate-binding protein
MQRRTSFPFKRSGRVLAAVLALLAAGASHAAEEKFVYLTNWFAQAEHGGFYQAVATGLYKKHGLDVSIKMGGPQVNGVQLLAAGQADCIMGSSQLQMTQARSNGVPIVTVAALFQKDPQALIAHEDVKSFEDMKGKTILIASTAQQGYWPWLKTKYGFTDAQTRPYTFSIQPFLADKNTVQQGYITSETYALQKAGAKFNAFLLADVGYPSYATTVSCMDSTVAKRSKAVQAFVQASIEGWKSYLANPAPGNALIKKDNPQMTDDQLAFSVAKLKEYGLVTGGDAAKNGIGTMTEARIKEGYAFLVANKLIDADKVKVEQTVNLQFLKSVKVLP